MDNMKQFKEYCEAYDQTGEKEYRDAAINLYYLIKGIRLTPEEFDEQYVKLMFQN